MTRWLWYINGGIAAAALLVLVIGLAGLGGENAALAGSENNGDAKQTGAGDDGAGDGTGGGDSALVAIARRYSKRFEPPPKPKPEPSKPKPVVKRENKPVIVKPVVTPPPPPPAPPIPAPKPMFIPEATMLIGPDYGLVWIKLPKDKESRLYSLGEKVGKFTISKIDDGFIEVELDGQRHVLKIPKPKIVTAPVKTPANKAKKTPTPRTAQERRRAASSRRNR